MLPSGFGLQASGFGPCAGLKPRAWSPEPNAIWLQTSGSRLRALPRERIRPNLEVHDLAFGPLAPFHVPDEVRAVVRPESAALPPGVRIVDASVHAARIEAKGVRHAQRRPFSRLGIEGEQRIRVRSGGERRVDAESRAVCPIHPVVLG